MTSRRLAYSFVLLTLIVISGLTVRTWNVSINGHPGSDADDAASVAIDSATGDIFVAGTRQTSETGGFFVEKMTADGAKSWQMVVTGSVPGGQASAVAVDRNGNVFVSGYVVNSDVRADIVLMKLDGRSPRKRVLWQRTVDVLGQSDIPNAIALTPDGGVAVVGYTNTSSGSLNFYAMKFTSDGGDAWAAPQVVSASEGEAVGILPGGDIVAAGYSYDDRSSFLVRFDGATGAQRWLVRLKDSGAGALSVAPNGDIFVGLHGVPGLWYERGAFSVMKVASSGAILWQRRLEAADVPFSQGTARTIAVAPDGSVIAAGDLENERWFVVSLGADGAERWRDERPGVVYSYGARAIAFDPGGNPVVAGTTKESAAALTTFTVVTYDRNTGAVLWDVPIVGTSSLGNEGHAVASNPATGSIVAVGIVTNDRTSHDMAVIGIRNGYEEWREVMTGAGRRTDRFDKALALAVDPRGRHIVLGGYAQNSASNLWGSPYEFRVVKLRANGSVAWKLDLDDPAPHITNSALAVAADAGGDVFAAGRTCAVSPVSCFTVVRISANGKELWRTIVPGASGSNQATKLVQDPEDGNLIVAGQIVESAGHLPVPAVFKLDARTGSVVWSASFTASGSSPVAAMALTSRGTVAAGAAESVMEFDTTTGIRVAQTAVSGTVSSLAFDERDNTLVVGANIIRTGFLPVAVVTAVSAGGAVMWTRQMESGAFVGAVAVRSETGEIAAAGNFVARLNGDGSEQWFIPQWIVYGNPERSLQTVLQGVAFVSNDMVGAGLIGDGRIREFAVVSYAEDGAERWHRTYGSDAGAAALAVFTNRKGSSIYAAGTVDAAAEGPNMFAVGLDADGWDL